MMNKCYLLIFFFFCLNCFSQKIFHGIVLDSLKQPVEYANVGILNSPIGTISQQNGAFELLFDDINLRDTLRVSCLGFKTKDFLVNDLNTMETIMIRLETEVIQLKEIQVISGNLKTHSDGKSKTETKNKVIFANEKFDNLNLGTEIGRRFDLGSKKPSLLTEFQFYISENNFESNSFKINIYDLKNGKPFNLRNSENIYISVGKDFTGWVSIQLEDYNLIVQEDVVVSVQWIKYSGNGNILNLPMIIPSLGSTHYYKFGTQNKWEKYGKVSSAMKLIYQQ